MENEDETIKAYPITYKLNNAPIDILIDLDVDHMGREINSLIITVDEVTYKFTKPELNKLLSELRKIVDGMSN